MNSENKAVWWGTVNQTFQESLVFGGAPAVQEHFWKRFLQKGGLRRGTSERQRCGSLLAYNTTDNVDRTHTTVCLHTGKLIGNSTKNTKCSTDRQVLDTTHCTTGFATNIFTHDSHRQTSTPLITRSHPNSRNFLRAALRTTTRATMTKENLETTCHH